MNVSMQVHQTRLLTFIANTCCQRIIVKVFNFAPKGKEQSSRAGCRKICPILDPIRNTMASRKRKTTATSTSSTVCDLDGTLTGKSIRQSSLVSFFGQPTKRIVSPQTPPYKKRNSSNQQLLVNNDSPSSLSSSIPSLKSQGSKASHSSNNQNDSLVMSSSLQPDTMTDGKRCLPVTNGPKVAKKTEQLYLDFGQASFGKRTQCPHCGTLYVEGVAEDVEAHERVCRDYREGVTFRITAAFLSNHKDALIKVGPQAYVVEVKGSKNLASWSTKVRQVRKIAERDLGFVASSSDEQENNPASIKTSSSTNQGSGSSPTYTYFLYVVQNRVVGLLATETISRACLLLDRCNSNGNNDINNGQSAMDQNPTKAAVCLGPARRANLGVHLLWVHDKHRGQGTARKLLNTARERCIYGYTSIPPERVAFSSPTEAGLGFAHSYMRALNAPVLVYQYTTLE